MAMVTHTDRDQRFESVYRDLERSVRLYASARVGRSHADDIVNATFVAVWQRLDDVPSGDARRPWVLGVCRNVCRNHRRSSRRFAALVDEIERARPTLTSELVDAGIDHELIGVAQHAVRTLSTDDRELFVLSGWLELSPAEIATVLDVSDGTIRVRLHRLRQRLRPLLAELRLGDS